VAWPRFSAGQFGSRPRSPIPARPQDSLAILPASGHANTCTSDGYIGRLGFKLEDRLLVRGRDDFDSEKTPAPIRVELIFPRGDGVAAIRTKGIEGGSVVWRERAPTFCVDTGGHSEGGSRFGRSQFRAGGGGGKNRAVRRYGPLSDLARADSRTMLQILGRIRRTRPHLAIRPTVP